MIVTTTTLTLYRQLGPARAQHPQLVTVDLDDLTPVAAALAEALSTNDGLSGGADVRLRSTRTRRQILETLPPLLRARRLEESEVYGIDLDAYDEISHSGWAPYRADQTPEQWLEGQAARLPIGYVPVAGGIFGAVTQVSDHVRGDAEQSAAGQETALTAVRGLTADLRALRLSTSAAEARWQDAIRSALSAGARVAVVAAAAGIGRERVYQIRDGRRR